MVSRATNRPSGQHERLISWVGAGLRSAGWAATVARTSAGLFWLSLAGTRSLGAYRLGK